MKKHYYALALSLFALPGLAKDAQTLEQRIAQTAADNRHELRLDDGQFSGPAWDLLVREGRAAKFFLLGEEHGIAENPQFAAALYAALAPSGYAHMAIEISPPMATELDLAARAGLDSLTAFLAQPESAVAFFGMAEEAQMLVDVRAASASEHSALWGLDYEVLADRHLIGQLQQMPKPEAAEEAMAALAQASAQSWQEYAETRGPQFIFSFAGDPVLVAALRASWPGADPNADRIMHTLEETLAVNQLWIAGKGWGSNQRRAELNRANFLRYWQAEKAAGRSPRVFAKFGASHMVRGRSSTEVFDLGTLLPEVAAIEGGHSFHLLVLPGIGADVGVLDPTKLRYAAAPAKDGYAKGLDSILNLAEADQYTLFDLRPLRALLGRWRDGTSPELMRVVHGYDALLLMNGSTASSNLLPDLSAP